MKTHASRSPRGRPTAAAVLAAGLTALLAVAPHVAGAADAAADPGKTALTEIDLPNAPPEYREACRLYLQAGVSDRGPHGYGPAIAALTKAGKAAESADVKLRCAFLLAFCRLLNGQCPEALQSALQALDLAKKQFADNPRIAGLDKALNAVRTGKLSQLPELADLLKLGEQAGGLAADLVALHQARESLDRKRDARWRRHKATMDKVIAAWARDEGLTSDQVKSMTDRLEKKFRPQGHVDVDKVEDDLVRISLDMLTE